MLESVLRDFILVLLYILSFSLEYATEWKGGLHGADCSADRESCFWVFGDFMQSLFRV